MSSSILLTKLLTIMGCSCPVSRKKLLQSSVVFWKDMNSCTKVMLRTCSIIKSQLQVDIRNVNLNIEKVGNGSHPILCLPGAFGYIESDFLPQLQQFNHQHFTIIAWDPPGYGKSRPPNRDLITDIRQTLASDGDMAHELMKKLGYTRYSLLGWNDGAITALFIANSYPESIKKIVIWGGNVYVTKKDRENFIKIRNIDSWPEEMRKPKTDIYGEEYFKRSWADWIDNFIERYEKDGDICKKLLSTIKCPTFIIHGEKDTVVDIEHAKYLHYHIRDSKFVIMPKGEHNLHLQFSKEFYSMVEPFLLENEPINVLNSLIE